MRIRTIKPDFWTSESISTVGAWHRLLFIGLWQIADREGRLEDRPKRIKAMLFPYDSIDVDELLDDLVAAKLITPYQAEGRDLLAIPGFARHQRPNHREPASILPDPSLSQALPVRHGHAQADLAGREGKGREGKGKEEGAEQCSAQADLGIAPPPSPDVLVYPCKGIPKTWGLKKSKVDEWLALFPGADVMASCRKALAWSVANPKKRKTAKRMESWLVGTWVGPDSDRGNRGAQRDQTPKKTVDEIDAELRDFVRRQGRKIDASS